MPSLHNSVELLSAKDELIMAAKKVVKLMRQEKGDYSDVITIQTANLNIVLHKKND